MLFLTQTANGHTVMGTVPGTVMGTVPGTVMGTVLIYVLGTVMGTTWWRLGEFFASAALWQLASARCGAQRAITMPCPTQRVLTLPARLLYQICRQPCGALCPCRAPGAPWRSIGLRGAREAHGALWGPMGPHRASSMGPYGSIGSVGLQRAP